MLPVYSMEDLFVEKTLSKDCVRRSVVKPIIRDEFVESSLDKNLKLKPRETKYIVDEFAEKNKSVSSKRVVKTVTYDEVLPKIDSSKVVSRKVVRIENSGLVIPVRISKSFTTRKKVDEGDIILFETTKELKIKNKTYPAGTPVKARIETISMNKSMGVPADLTIGNFSIDGIALAGEINKTGANRSLWLYPTMYALTCFFGIGIFLMPIRGGHAKINLNQEFLLYLQ